MPLTVEMRQVDCFAVAGGCQFFRVLLSALVRGAGFFRRGVVGLCGYSSVLPGGVESDVGAVRWSFFVRGDRAALLVLWAQLRRHLALALICAALLSGGDVAYVVCVR